MEFDLIKELEKYEPFDEIEKENVKRVLNFLKTNENCYNRNNEVGHITCGALVCDNKGNVLLNHHKKSNMWFQFGGHSDDDTNSLRVAKREVFEESGITEYKVISNTIFDVDIQDIDFDESFIHFHFDINFLFLVDNHNFKILT